MLEFDHLMICVNDPEAAVRALTERGWQLGGRGVHRGQGTSNACFYFDNGYLELVWASEPSELHAASAIGLATRLGWTSTGASPFGLSVRPTSAERSWPFETWGYAPPFLPPGVVPIPVLANSRLLHEPLAFVSYFPGPPKAFKQPPPLQAARGVHDVTGACIEYVDPRPPSKELLALQELGLGTFRAGCAQHRAELTLDGGRVGRVESFEPEIPLVLRW